MNIKRLIIIFISFLIVSLPEIVVRLMGNFTFSDVGWPAWRQFLMNIFDVLYAISTTLNFPVVFLLRTLPIIKPNQSVMDLIYVFLVLTNSLLWVLLIEQVVLLRKKTPKKIILGVVSLVTLIILSISLQMFEENYCIAEGERADPTRRAVDEKGIAIGWKAHMKCHETFSLVNALMGR